MIAVSKLCKAPGMAAITVLLAVLPPFASGAADLQVLTTADGLPSNWITALAATPEGKLWVGTGNAGVYLLDPATGRGTGYRASDGAPSGEVTSIALFGGKMYAGTASGLSVFDGVRWTAMTAVGSVTLRNVRLASSPDGKDLWACSVYLAGGTVKFDGTRWEFMGGKGRGLFNDIQGFAFLPEGVVMASGSGVPYLHQGGEVKSIAEGLRPGNAFSVAVAEKSLYLGTSRGLFRYEGKWEEVSLPAGFAGRPVFAMTGTDGAVIAGFQSGLVKVAKGSTGTIGAAAGFPASRVTSLAVAGDVVAAGTARGLVLVRKW